MPRLSAFLEQYPDAQIRGAQILGLQHAMGERILPYFAEAGYADIQPDAWYDMTGYLKVIYDIVEHEPGVMSNMVAIGTSVVEHALLPPEIDTLEKGLMSMQRGWQMNSRNARDVIWAVEKIDNHTFIVSNTSPFPADQEYGVLHGFARRFGGGQWVTVTYENLEDRTNQDQDAIRFVVKIES